ncbi:DUF4253 domain-containing protein [Streptomyces capparidis]
MTTSTNPLVSLAADPSGRSLGLAGLGLPSGTFFTETLGGTWPEPLLWRSDEPAGADSWARLLPARERAGLYPVLLGGEDGEPWHMELAPELAGEPDGHDGVAVLERWWAQRVAAGGGQAPFGTRWPGPAAAPPSPSPGEAPDAVAARVAGALVDFRALSAPRVGLIPARRGADVLAAVGWTGPLNYGNDAAPFSAVLRSWEDRFGARVVALESDVLHLAVPCPPRTVAQALPIAAEHFAFCPDNVWQGGGGLVRYAEQNLLGKRHWSFWWD